MYFDIFFIHFNNRPSTFVALLFILLLRSFTFTKFIYKNYYWIIHMTKHSIVSYWLFLSLKSRKYFLWIFHACQLLDNIFFVCIDNLSIFHSYDGEVKIYYFFLLKVWFECSKINWKFCKYLCLIWKFIVA
jgi:hypothetical protein